MPATRAEMRLRAQRRADMVGSSFVSDAEWNDYLNEGLAQLHWIVTGKHEDYIVSSVTITTVANQDEYDLPDDFMKDRGADILIGSTNRNMRKFMFSERNRFSDWLGIIDGRTSPCYAIVGNKFKMLPTPITTGDVVTFYYIPDAVLLTHDGHALDVGYANGWDRYIVLYAAIKALQKEESDVSTHFAELADLENKITSSAARGAGEPNRVVSTRYGATGYWR